MPLIFFFRNCNENYNEIYIVMGTSLTKLTLSLHKDSIAINTLFLPLRDKLYAGRFKNFAEALRACCQCPFHRFRSDTPSV
jgi:hypothetical protein